MVTFAETVTVTLPDGTHLDVDRAKLKKLAIETAVESASTRVSTHAAEAEAAVALPSAETLAKAQAIHAGNRYKVIDQLVNGVVKHEKIQPVPREDKDDLGPVLEAFRLRQSWDAVKLFRFDPLTDKWEESKTTGLASDGAEFSWSRNRLTQEDALTAKGVAFFPIVFNSTPFHHQFLLLPSVEFNRDSSTDGTKDEINALTARLGIDFNLVNTTDAEGTKGWVIRVAAGYQADFDFASGQWIFDLGGEWVNEKEGVGVFALRKKIEEGDSGNVMDPAVHESFQLPGTRRKLSLAPIFSLADVSGLGSKEALEQLGKNYATVGMKASLDFEIEAVKHVQFLAPLLTGLKIGAEYRWWSTLGVNSQNFDYLEAHITAPFLGSGDKVLLKAYYRRGDTPDTLEKADVMGLALTAKF